MVERSDPGCIGGAAEMQCGFPATAFRARTDARACPTPQDSWHADEAPVLAAPTLDHHRRGIGDDGL